MSHVVTVAVLDNPEQAAMARNMLDASGIPSFLVDDNMVGMAWHLAGAIIKLQVWADDEEDARALLDKDMFRGRGPDTNLAAGPAPMGGRGLEEAIAAGAPPASWKKTRQTDDDGEDPSPTLREKYALAAVRCIVIGLIFFPMFLFAYGALIQVVFSSERLAGRYLAYGWVAGVVLLAPFVLLMLAILSFFSYPPT